MLSKFSKNIKPYIDKEIFEAKLANKKGNYKKEFNHLENAHVLGQESTYHHTKIHFKMFIWGIKNKQKKEAVGQIIRIIGAVTKTIFGLIPNGNTGGSNISPIKSLPLKKEHSIIILKAKEK